MAALTVIGLGGLGFAADMFWHSPLAARLAAAATQHLAASSAGAGFVVTRVYSEGRVLADERSLQKALEPYYGKSILQVDLSGLKERVETVPWIRAASVSRRLPDTLWVRLEEHRPIARWLDGSRQVLVSDAGEVVRVKDAGRFRHLPLLFGNGAPARAEALLRLIGREPELAKHVTGARLVGERRWDIYLDGRIEVRLPASGEETAWRRLAREQSASSILGRAITAIDLRNPEWLTVQIANEAIEKRGTRPGA
jgi:cell division protein FtsQ